MRTRTIMVECTFTIPVEVPAEWDDGTASFCIEENGCPGTSSVGTALDAHLERYGTEMKGYCWACALNGRNRIVKPSPSPE